MFIYIIIRSGWECSGSVVECLTWDRGAAGSSLTSITALCPWARHINPSLVLVQPRKTHPFITERLLMGRKESNQTNKAPNKGTTIFIYLFQCSKTCGTGTKSRDILCLDSGLLPTSSCLSSDKPTVRRTCNTQSCDLPQLDEGQLQLTSFM